MGRFKISLGGIKCFASKQRILKATELYTLNGGIVWCLKRVYTI